MFRQPQMKNQTALQLAATAALAAGAGAFGQQFVDQTSTRFPVQAEYTNQCTFVDIDGAELDLTGFDDGFGTPNGGLEGHGYDISTTGMRFELDDELPAGTEVAISLYPPAETAPIHMNGVVVRVFAHDDDPGPRRMAVQFTTFPSVDDRERLMRRIDARACCWPR